MATAIAETPRVKSLNDAWVKQQLQELRQTDNVSNIWYFLRTYLYLFLVIGSTIGFYYLNADQDWGWWWNVPVTLLAIVLVGAGQHQLTGLAHEASHHILFRNRLLNDLASDWLCLFPLFSSTQHYRLQHLAHHQFVNDPARDPDISQLQTSGHWLHFPLQAGEFVRQLWKQLWPLNLFRYMRIRAAYNAIPTDKNPYLKKGWKPSKIPVRVGILYMAALVTMLTTFVILQNALLLGVVPTVLYLGIMTFYALIPEKLYHQSRIHPVISSRAMTLMRITYITALFCSLAWLSLLVDAWAAVYYLMLWLVPIFTSFSFFMILRQQVQHGNGDRGWLTNTRVFILEPAFNFAVMPLGQDYHLPHHLFASVPHYRLRQLHDILMQCEEYRKEAVEVHGYFRSPENPKVHPTVLDVLGPDYHVRAAEVYIDNEVLEGEQVEDREEILRQGEEEKQKRRAEVNA